MRTCSTKKAHWIGITTGESFTDRKYDVGVTRYCAMGRASNATKVGLKTRVYLLKFEKCKKSGCYSKSGRKTLYVQRITRTWTYGILLLTKKPMRAELCDKRLMMIHDREL